MITLPLTQGQVALIDDEHAALAHFKWQAKWDEDTQSFYAARASRQANGKRQTLGLHRAVMEMHIGRALVGDEHVDHINHDTLDCRTENMRLASGSQNHCNKRKYRTNKSGYKGVHLKEGRWRAEISAGGKRFSLGAYSTPEEAAAVYDAAALKYHGAFACPNARQVDNG